MAGLTPSAAAVPGISCVRPRAPAGLPAFGLKFDSWRIRPRRRAGSTSYFAAAASISAAYGVFAPGVADAPAGAVAAVVPVVALAAALGCAAADTEARRAAKSLDPDVVPVVVCGAPAGAPAGERPSMAS